MHGTSVCRPVMTQQLTPRPRRQAAAAHRGARGAPPARHAPLLAARANVAAYNNHVNTLITIYIINKYLISVDSSRCLSFIKRLKN